jgi:DNA-binding transcriptional LysR family regulator
LRAADSGARAVQSVLDNSVDFAIIQLPVQERKLEVVQIHTDEIRLLVPADHPLADATSVTAQDIVAYPLLLPKSGRTRLRISEFLEMIDDQLRISMELDSSEMMKQFIIADLGIGFMSVTNALNEINAGELRAIPLAPLPMMRTLGLIYRKDKPLSRAALGFIDEVVDFARRSPNAQKDRSAVKERVVLNPRKATKAS